ncbi:MULTISPECIES: hypothetical protein [Streptomyces]|uniref:Uncharacterized protein n=1 Tax=Streptomyces fradiae ATCC 10745 = DSM 40063 TaxID=1319510 RepID=A0A1Y2NT75_STRFR|nr:MULTISPECIES: hypothetical protein [Streptomyces]KAF0649184.1 hypothetical protein K701_13830 [Streptomyces fradiae ATCC 10745 = DSM 40063]OSY50279.1 hypothetical protein BG846_04100 [Streptomyces fradiae ATCC 10745 = DSM 40063]QEV12038.1 hypothetical protein CP974_08415 [Streptomyces fradiae ATCC 10745 = DSM 40063]
MTNQTPEPTADELRALLAVVRDAIALPHPATFADAETRARLLTARAMYAEVVIDQALAHGADTQWATDYLRARLAEHPPTGYRHTGETEAGR